MARLASIEALSARLAEGGKNNGKAATLTLSAGTCGEAHGAGKVAEALRRELAAAGLKERIGLRITGCQGFCEQEPLLIVEPAGILYCRVTPTDAREIVSAAAGGRVVERLLYRDPVSGKAAGREQEIGFFHRQDRSILGQNRLVDPGDIQDYLAIGGYSALAAVLAAGDPQAVIEQIGRSGLRGRGGAGFPTGRKWESCRRAAGSPKYVICNADEGDPGAYMDRSILEGNPHSVIEGMIIGAYAVGARHGTIYVRHEYPLAVRHAQEAVRQAGELGLLGENILGTGFSFDIQIARGGGAFVCGESTALMASLEGKVGEPQAKDVHTAERGVFGKPTVLNNVETWANVPPILRHGAEWFSAKGTASSKGTKIFALTGRVRNTGLVEVAMGTSIRSIVYDIGGGSQEAGRRIKAVQIGGPSGGCLPERLFDLPIDYETLAEHGAMVGSGGLVVMDERTCMVDVARYFLEFLLEESCGKCVPCRVGLRRMLEIVKDVMAGRATRDSLELLREVAETTAAASLCGLGKTAPNPVLTALRYFEEEFLAHVAEKRCPAGVCRGLARYRIDPQLCVACGACEEACPHGAAAEGPQGVRRIDQARCRRCGICLEHCSAGAIRVGSREEAQACLKPST